MARVMLTLPDEMLHEIDQAAQLEHRSRSELLREAVRLYLKTTPSTSEPKRRNKQAVGIIEQLRRQAQVRAQSASESVEIIRSFRGPLDENPSEEPLLTTQYINQ
jgi:metal-responsive CopG/Arc/MetJ family transcriptional regulator